MAIIANNMDDPNQQQQPNQGGSGTIMGAPGSAAPGAGGSSAYQAPGASSAPRANPSGAPNVQDYLNANQNAGAKLTSGITQNYQNQANQYQQGLNSQQQNLNTQYNPLNSQVSQGQQYANTAFQSPTDLLAAYQAQQAQTASANSPSSSAPAAPDTTALQNYNNLEGTVAGSQQNQQLQQGIAGYQNSGQQAGNYLQTQLGQLGQTAALGNNAMGQQQLLQQTVGTPNYTPGQQGLDTLFLQGNSNQLQNNLNNIYQTASGNTNTAAQDYQGKLNALQQMASGNQAYTQNLFLNGAAGQQDQGLNQIAGDVNKQYNALTGPNGMAAQQQAALQNAAKTNSFTSDQLKSLGLTSGQQTWGLTPQQLLTAGGYSPTAVAAYNQGGAAQAANSDQFARYNALNQLAGNPQNSVFGTSQQAGGYNPFTFNAAQEQNVVDTKKQAITHDALLQAVSQMGGDDTGRLMRTLQAGISNGSLTPEQANDLVNSQHADVNQMYNDMQSKGGTIDWGTVANEYQPWSNYYNGTYLPAAATHLNQTSPEATPLPWDANKGDVDWSSITAPKGK
jgi:hypothetical protein